MLEDTYERHILDKMYADERVGLYVIRGENLVLLGELDLAKEASQTAMTEVPLEVLLKEKAAKRQERVRTSVYIHTPKLIPPLINLGGRAGRRRTASQAYDAPGRAWLRRLPLNPLRGMAASLPQHDCAASPEHGRQRKLQRPRTATTAKLALRAGTLPALWLHGRRPIRMSLPSPLTGSFQGRRAPTGGGRRLVMGLGTAESLGEALLPPCCGTGLRWLGGACRSAPSPCPALANGAGLLSESSGWSRWSGAAPVLPAVRAPGTTAASAAALCGT